MRVAIFGIGAMGCLFGARLSPHADVTLVGRWREQLATLRRDGLRLETADGEERHHLQVTDDPAALAPVDCVLVLTKSSGTAWAAESAAGVLADDGLAVTLQNGIGNLETLAAEVGTRRTTLGITAQGASVLGPGRVRYAGPGPTHLAIRPEIASQVEELAALFESSGLESHVAEEVDSLIWGKLTINAGINALTAILRVPNGALLESEWARALMADAALETAAVAAARGINLPYQDPVARVETVARMTAANRSSMLQDVLRGATTEVETINGAIMREGQRLGVPTPVNASLYRMVKAIEALDKRI